MLETNRNQRNIKVSQRRTLDKNTVDVSEQMWTVRFEDSHKEILITVSSGIITSNGEWTGWTCKSPWIQIDFEKKIKVIVYHSYIL